MKLKEHSVLVTGGAGFIGSEFVRQLAEKGIKTTVIDTVSYAGDPERIREAEDFYEFYQIDICNKERVLDVFKKVKPTIVVHYAAETHVDRSILDASLFIDSNIKGTQVLLDASRESNVERFIYISTDEVYGDLGMEGCFTETTPFHPNSPYAVSKASADMLVQSYTRTYAFPAIIARPCNNYGPWQYPEKLLPVVIYKALHNEKVPVYAQGLNVREWLYVSDSVAAVLFLLEHGEIGQIYNIGSAEERKNIDVVKTVLSILDKPESLIQFVQDRPGHDFRYSLDFSKIQSLGWQPKTVFDSGILKTISWYLKHTDWLSQKVNYLEDYWKRVYKQP